MPKDLTIKDVLYALEYMRDAMVRVPSQTGGKPKWQMKAGGQSVKESVANEVRASGFVVSMPERNGSELIVWKAVA
jgi:hypothetical protein